MDTSPFCGVTDTSVLDFWWHLLWFQSQSGQPHSCLAEAYIFHSPWDSRLVQHPLASEPAWQLSCSLRHTWKQVLLGGGGLETSTYYAASHSVKPDSILPTDLYQLDYARASSCDFEDFLTTSQPVNSVHNIFFIYFFCQLYFRDYAGNTIRLKTTC